MTDRRRLARAGAALLLGLAASALLQASIGRDAAPIASRPPPHSRMALTAPPDRHRTPPQPQPVAVVPPGRSQVHVPILMYHYIRTNPDPGDRIGYNLSVTLADFERQMDWLAANGYHPIDFDDLRAYLLARADLPDRPVILTFDDGYRDMYTTAYPVLRAHHFKAVSYVVSGFVDSPRYVTVQQVLEMDANGIEIGSHTVSHADLTRLSGSDLWHEVLDSRVTLEALLGHPVLDFCYPSGQVNEAVLRAVEAAGYQTATTTRPGALHSAGDRFLWTRVRVDGGESLDQLVADLGSPETSELVTPPQPVPTPLHGPARRPVTVPLLPPREARYAAPPAVGPMP
ncbi:MAG TPA: polysaccharide deacetylase family protein [Candidatus Dormibacteraeota bacterium]